MKKSRGNVKIIILILFVCLLLFFVIMQISTNSIMKEVENAFLSKDVYITEDEYEQLYLYNVSENINFVIYDEKTSLYGKNFEYHFNQMPKGKENYLDGSTPNDFTIDLQLKRVLTLHNFSKGYLWLEYSCSVYNPEGEIIRGSSKIPVRLDIEKQNGNWVITRILERP